MRKITLVIFIIFIFFIFNTTLTQAQGQFACSYSISSGCYVDPTTNRCNAGYFPETSLCTNVKDEGPCLGTIGNCVTSKQNFYIIPGGGCNVCPTSGCPADTKVFDSLATCISSIGMGSTTVTCGSHGGNCQDTCVGKEEQLVKVPPLCPEKKFCCVLTPVVLSNPTCRDGAGINTAIGCIPVSNTNEFMGWMLGWAVGVGGGIAFLLIVYASFMIMTSQGVPDRLKAGQELLTSAISGLILLIFSVFILKFIGIDILGLGDFGFGKL